MKKYLIVCLLVLIPFFGCKQEKRESLKILNNPLCITLSDEKESSLDEKYAELVDIVKLETNDSSLLRYIDRICLDDNRFFLLDKSLNEIFIFDRQGKFIKGIHAVGQGPGEYNQLLDFYVDNLKKNIILLCDRPNKIMFFDYEGNFLKERRFKYLYLQIVADDNYLYVDNISHKSQLNNSQIIVLDHDGNTISHQLPLIDDHGINLFSSANYYTKNPYIYYTRRFDNSIYKMKDGQLEVAYVFDFKQYNLPQNVFDNFNLNQKDLDLKFRDFVYENKYIYTIHELSEGDRYLLINTNSSIFVLDKIELKLNKINYIKNQFIPIDTKNNLSINNSNGMFSCVYNSGSFNRLKEFIEKNESELNDKQKGFVMNVDEEDNPILFLYQLK